MKNEQNRQTEETENEVIVFKPRYVAPGIPYCIEWEEEFDDEFIEYLLYDCNWDD
jgi:hypothetical protein